MITIKNIELADLEQYAALCEELFESKTNTTRLKTILQKISANPDYILIGTIDAESQQLLGAVMGIVCMDTVGECRPFMVIENVVVSQKSRRLGIGKKLMSYIEDRARERNCYFTMFTSTAKRKEAHAFYESIGYPKGVVQGFKKYL
ncbi:GNAT family N-acetyltransferase [Sporomusa malonica]|uniref:Ribosomal protein S18 acetylase RimI n=1 Tax=Sporomusa malonica TaxID=112901 RepID=A0A1W2CBA0_9FIRM|nr:GNAT family N-acetyltransferase [Sporomusa malonica]SMC82162.1 Ribosomal protein S18 acetylase RimI [Sporomusa malonica]